MQQVNNCVQMCSLGNNQFTIFTFLYKNNNKVFSFLEVHDVTFCNSD